MKYYELTYLISPELKTEEAEILASEIRNFLQKEGALIVKSENPSPKTLGYTIKNQGASFLTTLEFSLSPEKVGTVEDRIKKDSRILRHLLLVKKPVQKKEEVITKEHIEEEKPQKPSFVKRTPEEKPEKKVELKDIDEKLEEILKE